MSWAVMKNRQCVQMMKALLYWQKALNRYANMTITYTMEAKKEILDGEKIHTWLSYAGGQVSIV